MSVSCPTVFRWCSHWNTLMWTSFCQKSLSSTAIVNTVSHGMASLNFVGHDFFTAVACVDLALRMSLVKCSLRMRKSACATIQ